MLKNKQLLAVAFVLGVVMPYVMSGNLKADVTNPYINTSASVEKTVIQYHLKVNELTNQFIEELLTADSPNVNYVSSDAECDNGNVSSYCLAVKLNSELVNFELALIERKYEVPIEDPNGDSSSSQISTIENAIEASAQQQGFIEEEIEAARDSLDLVLSVYNQLQIVYPVHQEFENVIKNLEIYNKNLAAIRNSVELFPSKFNDASTISCK